MSKEKKSEQLIRQIKAGRKSAMDELLKLWYKPVVHYAWRFTGDQYAAQEIGQTTFMIVFKKYHQLKDISKFKVWLYRIADNQCKDYLRRQKRYELVDEHNLEEGTGSKYNAQYALEQREKIAWIKKSLLKLPEEQRIIIVMKEYQGLKFREIAEILNISENTVKSRMYAGLKALKKNLNQANSEVHNLIF